MLTLSIAGTDRTRLVVPESLRVSNVLTRRADTAVFEIRKFGSRTFAPEVGQEVIILNGATRAFAGRIVTVDEQYEKLDVVGFRVSCQDYTRDLDHKLVVASFENQTVDAIVAAIAASYLPGTITLTNVDCPVTIKYIAFNYEYPTECFRQLAEAVNYDWYIDYDRDIHFFSKLSAVAPFELSDTGGKYVYDSLKIRKDITPVRNTVYVRGGEYQGDPFTVETLADGSQRVFGTEYRFNNIHVSVTGQAKSVGIDAIDNETDFDCLYNFQEKLIRFRSDKKPTADSSVKISGRPWLPVLVKVRDSNSIDTFSAAEGNGVYEYKIIDRSIKTKEGARQRALGELLAYSATLSEGEFETHEDGLVAGQRLRVQSTLRGLDEYYIVNKVETSVLVNNSSDTTLLYRISLMTTRTFDHIDLLQKLLNSKDKEISIAEDEVLDEIESVDDQISVTDSVTFTTETRPYQWGPGGVPQLYWNLGDWA